MSSTSVAFLTISVSRISWVVGNVSLLLGLHPVAGGRHNELSAGVECNRSCSYCVYVQSHVVGSVQAEVAISVVPMGYDVHLYTNNVTKYISAQRDNCKTLSTIVIIQ